jgi:hypothetical protein
MRRWVGYAVVGASLAALATIPALVPPPPVAAEGTLANLPPDCSGAVPSVPLLWPPNHKLTDVSVVGVVDPDGDPVHVTVTGVAQDEPLAGDGEGDTCPDAAGVGTSTARIRAERSGEGDGRVYHVSFAADDGRGGACTGQVQVCVRHDQRPGGTCGDQGPLVDSTGGGLCDAGGCAPEDCAPSTGALALRDCARDTLPHIVERRVSRARDLLGRMARLHGRAQGKRLGLAAARHLRKAAAAALRAAARDDLSPACSEALRERLEQGASCAVCSAG